MALFSCKRRPISRKGLFPWCPAHDGLNRFRLDLRGGGQCFTPLSVTHKYHVSFYTAADELLREMATGRFTMIPGKLGVDAVFVPADLPAHTIRHQTKQLRGDVRYAVELLCTAHRSYVPGKPLGEQKQEVHDTVLEAFQKLRHLGFLPITLGNVIVHHLSMVWLIASCMPTFKVAVRYLRNPSALV